MFNRKCSLCGGKLENGKCTLCGLDSRQTGSSISAEDLLDNDVFTDFDDFDDFDEDAYSKKFDNSQEVDNSDSYIYEYSFDDTSENDFSKQLKNLGNTLKTQLNIKLPDFKKDTSEGHPYMDQGDSSSYSQSFGGSSLGGASRKTSSPGKGAKFAIIVFASVFIIVIAAVVLSSPLDNGYNYGDASIQEDFDMQVQNYDYAVDVLPETGSEVALDLYQGTYLGGIDIPCGTYTIEKHGTYASLQLTDYENGVFAFVSLGDYNYDSSVTLENVNIYPTTIVEVLGDVSLTMTSSNAQPYKITKTPTAGGEDYSFTLYAWEEKRPIAGTYQLDISDYESFASVTVTKPNGDVDFYDLSYDSDYQSTYVNLLIPSNCTVTTDGDVTFTKLKDYNGYTADQIYQMYFGE